jgi:2-haloacid dehalogenase
MISLFTFDIFGTVVDWKSGLEDALERPVSDEEFDRFIDEQGRDEQAEYRPYTEITARSLVSVFGMDPEEAKLTGHHVGRWPLFPDAAEGLRRLSEIAPCWALSNSDVLHATEVQEQLGFQLAGWVSAEHVLSYKPALGHWEDVASRLQRAYDRSWWHVSAYGDYDLSVAQKLGLTCVYIPRRHHRPGPHDVQASDLLQLAEIAQSA